MEMSDENYVLVNPPTPDQAKAIFGLGGAYSTLPILWQKDSTLFITDPILRRLEKTMMKDTKYNREYSFWKSSIAVSFTEMTGSSIIGDGLKIRAGRQKIRKIIESFNRKINVLGDTIEDYISEIWYDSVIHGFALWRIHVSNEYENKVDIQRLDTKQITTYTHPTRGWTKFIQKTTVPTHPRKKNTWYRLSSWDTQSISRLYDYSIELIIPNEPEVVLYTRMFKSPPISTVLHWLVYKRWIAWFMRKFAEKYWAPPLIAYVGDAKNYLPTKPHLIREALDETGKALQNLRNFGATAVLGHTRIEQLKLDIGKSGGLYVDYIDLINKEVMFALFGSMGLRSPTGRETSPKALSLEFLRFVREKRRKIEVQLLNFYEKVLLPAHGETAKPGEIEVVYSPLRITEVLDHMRAVEIGSKMGIFMDAKERRKAAEIVFSFLHEQITPAQVKELDKKFMDLNAPSRTPGDSPGRPSKGKE